MSPTQEPFSERLRHLPMTTEETAITGLRFCVVCDEAWPCAVRRTGYKDDSEHPTASGDPLGSTYPGQLNEPFR